jgi:hypothetical protein
MTDAVYVERVLVAPSAPRHTVDLIDAGVDTEQQALSGVNGDGGDA